MQKVSYRKVTGVWNSVMISIMASVATWRRVNITCLPPDHRHDCRAMASLFYATRRVLDWQVDGRTSVCTWNRVACKAGRVAQLCARALYLTSAGSGTNAALCVVVGISPIKV